MKIIFLTTAAILCAAAPAAAQPWQSRQGQSIELQTRLDSGVRDGTISQRELLPLRESLRQLTMLERQLGIGGLTGREHATLQQRSEALRQQIDFAARSRGAGRFESGGRFANDLGFQNEGRAGWEARYDSEHRAAWDARYNDERSAAWDSGRRGDSRFGASSRFESSNRGDRFAGDARVGQRASRRMVEMPDQYRNEFRDSDDVYYRYDSDRAYEIDRHSGLILRLFDLID